MNTRDIFGVYPFQVGSQEAWALHDAFVWGEPVQQYAVGVPQNEIVALFESHFLNPQRIQLGMSPILFRWGGELVLVDGTSVPIEIKLRMNWLKACQANWQFARFLGQTHKPICNAGIVFFQEFSGDWARIAKSRPIQNGWLRWYLEHHEINGLQFHLIKLQDGKAETYSEVVAGSVGQK